MEQLLGKQSYEALLRNKEEEWDSYNRQISDYEIKKYLSIL